MNELGGYRNTVAVALTGLDIEAKAELAAAAFWGACPYGPDDFAAVDSRVIRTDQPDPATNEAATAQWRITVKDPDERKVGRAFPMRTFTPRWRASPACTDSAADRRRPRRSGSTGPAKVAAELVPQYVHARRERRARSSRSPAGSPVDDRRRAARSAFGPVRRRVPPLGPIVGARSGDKGGNANLGVFARSAEAFAWLDGFLTVERLASCCPRPPRSRSIGPTSRIWSLNFVIHGLLDEGVAASTRQDAQAKSLGEWLRARVVDIPVDLIG